MKTCPQCGDPIPLRSRRYATGFYTSRKTRVCSEKCQYYLSVKMIDEENGPDFAEARDEYDNMMEHESEILAEIGAGCHGPVIHLITN